MLSPQQFAAAWGKDRYLFSADQLQDISLPETSETFLLEAGLPLWAEVPLGFYVVPLPVILPTSPVRPANYLLLARYQSTGFRLLADLHYDNHLSNAEADIYYVVQEGTGHVYFIAARYNIDEGTGRVHLVQPGSSGILSRFVNTSLSQFAESLFYYREFVADFRPTEPERSQVPILVGSLEQKWREIDPTAMAHPGNCWPRGVADMEMHL